MKRMCGVPANRSEQARLKAVMAAIPVRRYLKLSLFVIGAQFILDFGSTIDQIRRDGFPVFATTYTIIHGEDCASMSKSIGLGVIELIDAPYDTDAMREAISHRLTMVPILLNLSTVTALRVPGRPRFLSARSSGRSRRRCPINLP